MKTLGLRFAAFALSLLALAPAAWGSAPVGEPIDGQLGFQDAATPVMEEIHKFHNFLLWIIIAISVFVLALMLYVMIRFNRRANPTPAKFSHNTLVEVIWTAGPVLILIAIAIPSFRLLYFQDRVPEQYDLTVKAVGYTWRWGYSYPDQELAEYPSSMLDVAEDAPNRKAALAALMEEHGHAERHYRLAVDSSMVVPAGKTVRVQVTADTVIHNWAVPSFGIKSDAIPGRINETWFRVDEPGVYYGQCSELCGIRHAFMPIQVDVVPQPVFDAWLEAAQASPLGGAGEEPRAIMVAFRNSLRNGGDDADGTAIAQIPVRALPLEGAL